MQFKKELLVFPTSRAIRKYLSSLKKSNQLLPFCLTIDEFLKKSISLDGKKYCEEEQRFLFLSQAIKDIDIKKLGISSSFTKFLKQNEYIYRFFLELASEKVDINKIEIADTYDYYFEHLSILKNIKNNYLNILQDGNFVDKINLEENYKLNEDFLDKFEKIELFFEGYFTKVEFEIIEKISEKKSLNISFHSNTYNQKSLEVFDFLNEKLKIDYDYKVDLSNKTIITETKTKRLLEDFEAKGFSQRLNQIAYIKSIISKEVKNNIEPSKIAVVLPDEKFALQLQLFDDEHYFNYAMGKSVKNYKLYQVANAINSYLNEDEIKHISNLSYQKLDKKFIDEKIKTLWNKVCTKEHFSFISDFIKSVEDEKELIEKYDETIYKLNTLLFSTNEKILLKDVYKIFLQKISKITLDDVNSGKVTVLGLLETRMMEFDVLIVCDFNESFIPKKSLKDKFLSTKLKQMANLPTQFDRENLQKYYYKRLISSSKKVYISYENSDTNQISRFANELFDEQINTNINDNAYKHILYNNTLLKHFDEEIVQRFDLSKFIWSASSFKTFLQCRRKFYLQYILKLREHDISLKPKAYELGDIIHKILEEYYSQENHTYKKLEELFLKHKSINPFLIFDLEVWKKRLKEFHKYDLKRLEERKIIALEKEFTSDFEGIKIKGFIDRIDLYKDRYEVIDYKTSSSLKVDSVRNYEKSEDFQLEFYYLGVSELFKTDKIDTFYYDLSNTKLLQEIALDKKLELLVEKFDELKEFSKDEISFFKCENKTTCQFCTYQTICNRE